MLNIVEMTRTCYACPSQWDGLTDDNRKVYVRYRWGNLSVDVGKTGDMSDMAAVGGDCVFAKGLGDSYDGMLEYRDLKQILEVAGVAKLPDTSSGEDGATYLMAAEVFAKASENLNRLIAEGVITVIPDTGKLPDDAVVVTQDLESKEAMERRGMQVLNELPKV